MNKIIFAASVCSCMAAFAPAFAERWVAPVNGTVSAVMMNDGDVMMKVQIPEQEFRVVDRDMKARLDHCTIKEIDTDTPDSMILVCGKN